MTDPPTCQNVIDDGPAVRECGRPAAVALTYDATLDGQRYRVRLLACERCEPEYSCDSLLRVERLGLDHPFSGARPGWTLARFGNLGMIEVDYRPGGVRRGQLSRRSDVDCDGTFMAYVFDVDGVLVQARPFAYSGEAAAWVETHPHLAGVRQ